MRNIGKRVAKMYLLDKSKKFWDYNVIRVTISNINIINIYLLKCRRQILMFLS